MRAGGENKSRLARFLNVPDGLNMAEANVRADLHLQMLGDKPLTEMREALDALGGLLGAGDAPDSAARHEMQQLAVTITSLGGTFGREGLSKAGYSLCALLDQVGEAWDGEAVRVHYNAMRLLFMPSALPPEAQAALLDGLDKVRQRIVALHAAT